jgi:hypothetical protein
MTNKTLMYVGAGAALGIAGYFVYRHFYVPLDTDKVKDATLGAATPEGKLPATFKFDRGPSLVASLQAPAVPASQALTTLKGVAVGRTRAEVKALTAIG